MIHLSPTLSIRPDYHYPAYHTKMPYAPERQPPIVKAAVKPASEPGHSAAFIFLHGLGDEAAGVESECHLSDL